MVNKCLEMLEGAGGEQHLQAHQGTGAFRGAEQEEEPHLHWVRKENICFPFF